MGRRKWNKFYTVCNNKTKKVPIKYVTHIYIFYIFQNKNICVFSVIHFLPHQVYFFLSSIIIIFFLSLSTVQILPCMDKKKKTTTTTKSNHQNFELNSNTQLHSVISFYT